MELDRQEREDKRMDDYYLYLHANPMVEPEYRKQYINAIEPEHRRQKLELKTDIEQLKRIKERHLKGV